MNGGGNFDPTCLTFQPLAASFHVTLVPQIFISNIYDYIYEKCRQFMQKILINKTKKYISLALLIP